MHYKGKKHQKKVNEYICNIYKEMGINPKRFLVSVPEGEDLEEEIAEVPVVKIDELPENFFEKYFSVENKGKIG